MKRYLASSILLLISMVLGNKTFAQADTVAYLLTIKQERITIAGKEATGMTINGSIPGPTLRFKEGDYAVIDVKNEMAVETSVHWHGILLPNFFDGVPYLTTPPIAPGTTFRYEFEIIQTGTYWYHSHTALQEQSGLYGSIVIEPRDETLDYDKDLVVVFADWTYENPRNVLRTLKRGLEWYNIKKGTIAPLNKVIARGALGAQWNFWRQRMEGMDISDVYYPVFIANGQPIQEYSDFDAGERIRLRIINAAASTQFWLTFGGSSPQLVAADGPEIVPIRKKKTFIAVAETYDFIVEIPQNGKLEVRATAQDGTGQTSIFLGRGPTLHAPDDLPKPDLIEMMKEMAAMGMRMRDNAIKANPKKENPVELAKHFGMWNGHEGHAQQNDTDPHVGHQQPADEDRKHDGHTPSDETKEDTEEEMNHGKMDHGQMDHGQGHGEKETPPDKMPLEGMDAGHEMGDMAMNAEFNYDYLKSEESTDFKDKPVRDIVLNLTGNMQRYIWSMNSVPLSEGDKIMIKQGEVVRIKLINLTMMHHPMHLHGHFFRVLNKNGAYSPLKHTVNVAPMQAVTIEFDANEYGDWFFHCHILYHMDAGMARIFGYGTPRDERMKGYPLRILTNMSNHFFTWGLLDVASHMTELNVATSNIRNLFMLSAEYGWNENIEAELTYDRYLSDYLSVFVGFNLENERENSMDKLEPTAVAGIRYLAPFIINLDVRIDNKLRPQIALQREMMIFRYIALFGSYEYQADFGWGNDLTSENGETVEKFRSEATWNVGLEYFLSKTFSVMASYDNRFGAGGGLSIRF